LLDFDFPDLLLLLDAHHPLLQLEEEPPPLPDLPEEESQPEGDQSSFHPPPSLFPDLPELDDQSDDDCHPMPPHSCSCRCCSLSAVVAVAPKASPAAGEDIEAAAAATSVVAMIGLTILIL